MKWIGLTGGIATGKSTVSELLRHRGQVVADADAYAKDALRLGTDEFQKTIQAFGPGIVKDGEIDRQKLAQLVFQDETKKNALEKIIHPFVQKKVSELRNKWENEGRRFAFYDVPLLFEKNLVPQFDAIVMVTAREQLQTSRMKLRNKWSDSEIEARLQNQLPLSHKVKNSHHVIDNSGSLEELETKVDQLLIKLNTLDSD